MRIPLLVVFVVAIFASSASAQTPAAAGPKPVRINKAIDLLEQGQPVYYDTTTVGGFDQGRKFAPAVLTQARSRVLAATKAANIFFLNSCDADNVAEMIKDGVMICAGTGGAEAGRQITKRQMP